MVSISLTESLFKINAILELAYPVKDNICLKYMYNPKLFS